MAVCWLLNKAGAGEPWPAGSCTSPMGLARTAPLDSIRCRALEAMVLLMDKEDTEEETRDVACQTDCCIEADQSWSCRTRAEDIASTYAGDSSGPVLLAASTHTPSLLEEQRVPSSGRDQANPPPNLQERDKLGNQAPLPRPTLRTASSGVKHAPHLAAAHAHPVASPTPVIEHKQALPTILELSLSQGILPSHEQRLHLARAVVRRLFLCFVTHWMR